MADLLAFLREALRPLFSRRMLVPALLLALLLTASNIVIVRNAPAPGAALPPLFIAAALARIGGLLCFIVAIVRILAASPRRPWLPDGAFWLSALAAILLFAVSAPVGAALGSENGVLNAAMANVLTTVALAPLAPWLVALAAEKPLAWQPAPWLRNFRAWLPQLIFWAVLLVVPLGLAHGEIDRAVLDGVGAWFWPAMLVDGPLSAVMALLALGLNNAAYWRVARR